jgi:protease-4
MLFKKEARRMEAALGAEGPADSWERGLVQEVVTASLKEARRSRRWGILFKLLTFIYLFALLWLFLAEEVRETVKKTEPHTALVEVKGVIAPETKASADKITEGLRDAFEDDKTRGVILRINSPGGSPVQSGYVYDEIRRLRKEHEDVPVYAVIADIGASGAYYIASAADGIYADKASIVGSIGVLMNGFGFVDTLKDLGIERRLLTAGAHKGIMDPFSPMTEQDQRFVQTLLERLHEQFIESVKAGRKDKLKDDPEIFSGLFWSGEEALDLGLVDGLGSSAYVAREVIKAEKMVDFTPKDDWVKRLSERLGTSVGTGLATILGLDGRPVLR